jgi:phosphoenolpyruvate---glycerone phosphotransferase subunit DhaL
MSNRFSFGCFSSLNIEPKPTMSLHRIIHAATQTLIDHVDELTTLDQAIGDGDHGLNMRRGALAIQDKVAGMPDAGLNELLIAMGKTCVATIGGSSGPVFGTLMMTLGKQLPSPCNAADMALALRASIEALTRLGKAEVGQKTLLDVLDPVQTELTKADMSGDNLLARLKQCAFDSAAATAHMDATRGRSSFLGDRAKGHVDPGSRSMALIIGAVCDGLQSS